MDYIRKIKDELMTLAKKHPRHLNVEGDNLKVCAMRE